MTDVKGPWTINGNGYFGQLWIEGVDGLGNLLPNSTVYGDPLFGFWNDAASTLTFMRVINAGDPSTIQVYTGFLMVSQEDGSLAFAGSFEGFSGTGAVASRTLYGWYAMRKQ